MTTLIVILIGFIISSCVMFLYERLDLDIQDTFDSFFRGVGISAMIAAIMAFTYFLLR